MKLIVGVTGASGAIYAKVLFDSLLKVGEKVGNVAVLFSDTAKSVWQYELGNSDYEKLPFVDEMGYKDYYIHIYDTDGFSNNVFTNWFIPDDIKGEWKIVNSLEEIEIFLNSNKYNL